MGRSGRRKAKKHQTAVSGVLVLPTFHPTPIYSKIFRYKVGTAIVGQNITQANIFAMWVMAITTTVSRSVMASMRVKHIRAIATGLSATTTDELYIRDDNINGMIDPVDQSSTGQGNAIVTWKPHKTSLSALGFQSSTGNAVCILSVPAGATIEFAVDFTLSGFAGAGLTATYTSAYTAGVMYSMGPDGASGSIYYAAIGMNQA